jgi:CheY-like chemotaxis protein
MRPVPLPHPDHGDDRAPAAVRSDPQAHSSQLAERSHLTLAAVAGDCPDGILLDINLPGRDGFAVAAAIAATHPAVRIVLTSSIPNTCPVHC